MNVRRIGIRVLGWWLGVLGVGTSFAWAETTGFGPVSTRNLQPFQQLVLSLPGDRAAVLPKGGFEVRGELAVTNSVFSEETNPPNFAEVRSTVKMEQLRSNLFFRYGLTDRLELGFELPTLYRYSGVFHGLATGFERAVVQETATRRGLRDTGFAMAVGRNGQTLFMGGNRQFGLGDIVFSAKYLAVSETESRPAVAIRGAVKAPTGDADHIFGSGHPDFGLGLAVEKHVAQRWILYGNVNGVIPTGTVTAAGLNLGPTLSVMASAEFLWSERFSTVAQFDFFSSPYNHTSVKLLDRGLTEAVLGINYRFNQVCRWQVYAIENVDLITGGNPDFTLGTSVTLQF